MTNKTPNVSVVTKEKVTTINDVPKALADENAKMNEIMKALKQKNPQGPQRAAIMDHIRLSTENMVAITISALQNGLIETDEYGLITGKINADKFKGYAGDVSKYAKAFTSKMQKTPAQEGALISDVELAKLMETPYEYEPKDISQEEGYDENNMKQVDKKDIPEVNDTTVTKITDVEGNVAIVDKEENAVYMEGTDPETGEQVTWKKRILSRGRQWFEIAKVIATSLFNFCWDTVKSVAQFTMDLFGGTVSTVSCASSKLFGAVGKLGTNLKTGANTLVARVTIGTKLAINKHPTVG